MVFPLLAAVLTFAASLHYETLPFTDALVLRREQHSKPTTASSIVEGGDDNSSNSANGAQWAPGQDPSITLQKAPCKIGFFECDHGDYCVHQQYICDNIVHCFDASDELNCTDSTKSNYYNKLFSKRPDEDREKLPPNCTLPHVPGHVLRKCFCSFTNLYCVSQNLTRIPFGLPVDTNELDLSGNHFDSIQNDNFPHKLRSLKSLIITKSGLHYVAREAFENLTELSYLNLIGNQIQRFLPRTFARNRKLKLLYLSHNPISQLSNETFFGLENLIELDLRYCALSSLPAEVFRPLRKLEILWLQRNYIQFIHPDALINLDQLDTLSLAYNRLSLVFDSIFIDLNQLTSLSLAYNNIDNLEEGNFENLVSLNKLDLSHNKIDFVHPQAFIGLSRLLSLDLRGNRIRKFPPHVFDELYDLTYIYFDNFKMCTYALSVRVCSPHGDGISSVQHLLDNIILRVSVWIVALIACVGNLSVIIGRMVMHEMNEVHSFFIKNLAMADLLMGVYLFVIAYHDLLFRNEYIHHEEAWRASWQCTFSGVISTVSSEASVFTLAVITADRYYSVMNPFGFARHTMYYALVAMLAVWSISVALAILPVLADSWFGHEFYGSNGVCLALHIHETFSMGWEYSTFLFCGLNSAAFIFITYAYAKMASTITSSGLGLRTTQQQQDRNIAKRCAFIVATDALCWFPIVVIKLMAISGVTVDQDLYAWVAIFLLPVNSALNPVLYTLTTKLFKQQLNRIISHSFSSQRQPTSNMNENSSSSYCSINQLNHTHHLAGGETVLGVMSRQHSARNGRANHHLQQHNYQQQQLNATNGNSRQSTGSNVNSPSLTPRSIHKASTATSTTIAAAEDSNGAQSGSLCRRFNRKFMLTVFSDGRMTSCGSDNSLEQHEMVGLAAESEPASDGTGEQQQQKQANCEPPRRLTPREARSLGIHDPTLSYC